MGWGVKEKNPDIVLITVLNFRWEKPCSFRENWIFWKFRHDTRKIYNNLFIMFNLTLTRKPSLWERRLYFHPNDVQLRFSTSLPFLGTFFLKTPYLLLTANRDTFVLQHPSSNFTAFSTDLDASPKRTGLENSLNFLIFLDFSRSNFSQAKIVVVVPSNRNQLLPTCKCWGSAAECLMLGTIPSCG